MAPDGRERFTLPIKCADCGQQGAVTWEENGASNRAQGSERQLVALSEGFHTETGRTRSRDPLIVCDHCDGYLVD